jgi:hypothetical protein
VYIFNPFGPQLTSQVLTKICQHARETSHLFLVAFAGVDDRQRDVVSSYFHLGGMTMIYRCRTMDPHSSWILGAKMAPLRSSE